MKKWPSSCFVEVIVPRCSSLFPLHSSIRNRIYRNCNYHEFHAAGDVELSCLHIEHLILRAPLSKVRDGGLFPCVTSRATAYAPIQVPEVHAPHVKAPAHIGDFALTEGDPLINFALYDASDSAATLICYSVESVQVQST